MASFSQWVDAYARHQTRLADFYRRRFRSEFQPAVAAWIATRPLVNPAAPLTPFAMPSYRLAATVQAQRLTAAAEAAAAQAGRDIQYANDHVLAVVLFSAALFFGGISTRLQGPARGRWSWGSGVRCWSAPWPGSRPSRSASRSRGGSP